MRIRAPQEAKNKKQNGNLHRLGDASSFSVPSKALCFAGKIKIAADRSRISALNQETKRMQWLNGSSQSPA
jgi:hypothetical protein